MNPSSQLCGFGFWFFLRLFFCLFDKEEEDDDDGDENNCQNFSRLNRLLLLWIIGTFTSLLLLSLFISLYILVPYCFKFVSVLLLFFFGWPNIFRFVSFKIKIGLWLLNLLLLFCPFD